MFFPDEDILHLSKNNSWCFRVFPLCHSHFKQDISKITQVIASREWIFAASWNHKLINPFVYFVVLFFSAIFSFSFLNHCALDVSSEKMCLGEDAHKYSEYISKNSWEGLEKRNPTCGTAGYFCELLFTSCWTSSHLFTFIFCITYLKQGPIHLCGGLELQFFQLSTAFTVFLILPRWY